MSLPMAAMQQASQCVAQTGTMDHRNHQTFRRAIGFAVLPRRWVVERTLAWLGRCRRLAKDFEATIASAVAWVLVAHIRTLTRRLARA
jgi:transposase